MISLIKFLPVYMYVVNIKLEAKSKKKKGDYKYILEQVCQYIARFCVSTSIPNNPQRNQWKIYDCFHGDSVFSELTWW